MQKLAEEEAERLLRMEEILHRRVIGQHEAVEAVSRAIRRGRAGSRSKGPLALLSFWGLPVWGKQSWPAAWLKRSLGMRKQWSAWICPSIWRNTPFHG